MCALEGGGREIWIGVREAFYGVRVREKSVTRLCSPRRQAKRVWPRVTKLYREKIYFPVTATTYPDAFYAFTTADPPHSISNRPRDGGGLPLKICRACIEHRSLTIWMDFEIFLRLFFSRISITLMRQLTWSILTFISSVSDKMKKINRCEKYSNKIYSHDSRYNIWFIFQT